MFNALTPGQDLINNSPYCLPYNIYDAISENLELDQLKNPLTYIFFILITRLIDIVRRNSILVTHGSLRVKLMIACIFKVLMQRYSFCVSHTKLLVSSLF